MVPSTGLVHLRNAMGTRRAKCDAQVLHRFKVYGPRMRDVSRDQEDAV